jgi:glycosyltransferase involved in cell wall biosynthesis
LKLSIITINLNNSAGLRKTIKSVLFQTYSDYEWILIDGGSTDDSIETIKKHSARFTFWESVPDKGIYHAQNKGILKAKGDYCFFLNSGDYLADRRVLEEVFKSNPEEDILFGNLYVTDKGKIIGKAYGKEHLTFSDVYAHIIKHQASFIKRDLFEQFGLYNENRKIIADWEFFIKTIGLGNVTYHYIDLFITYFDNGGLSNRNASIVHIEREQVIKDNIPLLMHPDYEFLLKYRKYQTIYTNSFSFFLIRLINKIMYKK